MIFEEQFPVPRYTAASKIGNSVISLLWQLWCRCNPDRNKFSSSSNTTVVAIFPKFSFWRRSLCSNLGGIDPEKLYRATLSVSKNPQVFTSKLKIYVLSRRFPGVGCFQRWTHEKKMVQGFLSTAKIITKYSSESFFFLFKVN